MIYINGCDEETIIFFTGWNQATKITRQNLLTVRRKWKCHKTESESEATNRTFCVNKKWNYYEMPNFHQKSDYLYQMPNMPDNFYQRRHIPEIRLFIADACPCSNMGWCVLFYTNSWHYTISAKFSFRGFPFQHTFLGYRPKCSVLKWWREKIVACQLFIVMIVIIFYRNWYLNLFYKTKQLSGLIFRPSHTKVYQSKEAVQIFSGFHNWF